MFVIMYTPDKGKTGLLFRGFNRDGSPDFSNLNGWNCKFEFTDRDEANRMLTLVLEAARYHGELITGLIFVSTMP